MQQVVLDALRETFQSELQAHESRVGEGVMLKVEQCFQKWLGGQPQLSETHATSTTSLPAGGGPAPWAVPPAPRTGTLAIARKGDELPPRPAPRKSGAFAAGMGI